MSINLSKLDEEIRRLQEIKRVMSDPKSAALVAELLRPNGTRPSEARPVARPAETDPPDATSKTGFVREAIQTHHGRFTVDSIANKVRGGGHDITNLVVAKILQRMASRKEIRIAIRGTGGKVPNQYEKRTEPSPGG